MKKPSRLLAVLLAVCVAAAAFPPAGLAAEEDIPSDLIDVSSELLNGGTVTLTGNSFIEIPAESGVAARAIPWIIRNATTVDGAGYSLTVYGTGILLGADAVFQNMTLNLPSTDCRNAIIANGYNLTLNNVKAGAGNRSINLFGGTLVKSAFETYFTVPASESGGTITIQGGTNLQADNTFGPANIYAGSLSMGYLDLTAGEAFDGPDTTFNGPVTIDIQGSGGAGALGAIYAGGAQQRREFGSNGEVGGKVTLHDAKKYTVNGTVTISGTNGIPDVYGTGSAATNVVYQGGGNQADQTLQDISSLSVESGKLLLKSESYFRNGGTLTLGNGAKLLLSGYPDPIPNFQGEGGILILGQSQTLTISNSAAGTAKVAIGDTNADNDASTAMATAGHIYIQTPASSGAVFQLLPYPTQSDMTLEQNESGGWAATGGTSGGEESKLISLNPPATSQANSNQTDIYIPLNPHYSPTGTPPGLENIPLTFSLWIDGTKAGFNGLGYTVPSQPTYTYSLSAGYFDEQNPSSLSISVYDSETDSSAIIPDGDYTIQITVPGAYTQSGSDVTASCTLTVGDPGPTAIPVPTAITGLKYTGQLQTGVSEGTGYALEGHQATEVGEYTAKATLQAGYKWNDNTTEVKSITWRIAKADGPAAPTGLSASAPTSAGGSDGKISGTTADMEYAAKADFLDKQDCGAGETTGLAAGTYYVRLKETATHEAGAYAMITVPAYGAPTVQSIRVNSTGHKTEYTVGDALDVLRLTIEATYSNDEKQTVPVTAAMVSGFDSSRAAESQTLTITYEGKKTTYTVKIAAAQQPGGETHKLTIGNTGSGGTAPGDYEYAEGAAVTVQAGTRSGYTFSAWDPAGVTLANRNVPDISFQMPAGDVTLNVIWRPDSITPPGHVHAWNAAWSSNATHHWHDCSASGCPIGDNALKSGYASHTAGNWIVDQPASAYRSGVRHRACTVCGYEMVRETIPATGGGSSGGSGGSSSDSSSGTPSPGGPSGNNTTSVKNPDGSSTSTNTNRSTGTVTETTRRTDGSSTVVETKRDGTVTTTDTAADGSTVKTVARPDGTTETTVKQADGLTATVQERAGGDRATVRIPAKLAAESGSVALPIPALSGTNASVTVHTGSARPVAVEIPVYGDAATTVACLTGSDGRETIVKTALLSGGQITVSVPDGATVRIRDNRKSFQDTRNHWAGDAIDFVAARELFSGTSAGTFSPDAPMSRAMLSTVLARLDGADLSGGSVYQRSVAWAVSQGISDGRNPEAQVTREQLVTMLYRYAGSPAATERELRFSDTGSISSYAREAVRWAAENGILSGYEDGSFAPKGRATRAQTAAILARYVQFLNRQ